MNKVLESTKSVVENSQNVRINKENLLKFCLEFKLKKMPFWLASLPFDFQKLEDKKERDFLFVLDSICFSFWGEPKWSVEYKGNFYDGAWGLFAALRKAIEEGFPILDWRYLSTISENDLGEILEGNVEVPLFKERLSILRENAKILIEKFNGDFENAVKRGREDALRLLDVIVENFPSFNDFVIYEGQKVFIYKRAQLLIADIYREFENKKYGKLKNVDKLTALADYKIPQVLRRLGILEYSPELSAKVDNKIFIPPGSREEIEIRASTIWTIELMKKEIKKKIPNIEAIDIDSFLWLEGKKKFPDDKPYHLTRTTFY